MKILKYIALTSIVVGLGCFVVAITINMSPQLYDSGELVYQDSNATEYTFSTTFEQQTQYYLQFTCEHGLREFNTQVEIWLNGVLLRNSTLKRASTSPDRQGAGISYGSLLFETNQSSNVFEVVIYNRINTGIFEVKIWEDPSETLIWLRQNEQGFLLVGVVLFFGTVIGSFFILSVKSKR